MFDSDLAMLYQVETKVLNQAVKRNISRFPDRFRFQLTREEFDNLKSQIVTSSLYVDGSGYGGRRKLPFAFTEQGISMLSAVLRSEIAIQVSIRIMDTFVEMRKYLANNTLLLSEVSHIKTRQIESDIQREAFEEKTERRFEQIFDYISEHEESTQKVFFEGCREKVLCCKFASRRRYSQGYFTTFTIRNRGIIFRVEQRGKCKNDICAIIKPGKS